MVNRKQSNMTWNLELLLFALNRLPNILEEENEDDPE